MSQSSVAHLKKDIGGEIERQKGGRPKLLANVVTLVTEGRLGTTSMTSKQRRSEIGTLLSNITVRRALREVGWVHKCNKEVISESLICSRTLQICSKIQELKH